MNNFVDLSGQRFGKWKVVERNIGTTSKETMWLCLCEGCGKIKSVSGGNLRSGNTNGCRQCRVSLPYGIASFNSLFHSYKKGAEERNLEFSLTEDEFRDLTSSSCDYCGIAPLQIWKRGATNGHYQYNGIDRKNNSIGYVSDNVVSCCGECNRFKRHISYEDFCQWLTRIVQFRNQ